LRFSPSDPVPTPHIAITPRDIFHDRFGYVEGQNLAIEYRGAALASDLVTLRGPSSSRLIAGINGEIAA
jgi:hypothetical protein